MVALRLIGANDTINVIGETEDPEFRLGKAADGTDIDLGAPAPDQDLIEYEVLDGGSVGTDDRWTNRNPHLPLLITGATAAERTANVNRALRIVGAPGGFTLEWTPDNGLPVYIRSARAMFNRRSRVLRRWVPLDLTSVAEPFGRSDIADSIDSESSIVVLDAMNDDTDLGGATYDDTIHYSGSGSARVTLHRYSVGAAYAYHTTAPFGRPFATPQDLSDMTSIGFRLEWIAPPMLSGWKTTVELTLTDGTDSATVSKRVTVYFAKRWHALVFNLADFSGIDLSNVTEWSAEIDTAKNWKGGNATPPSTSSAYADEMVAYPSGAVSITTISGDVQTVPGVKGTAHSNVSLQILRSGGGSFMSCLIHRPPVEQDPDLAIIVDTPSDAATIDPLNGRFDGTYKAVALISADGVPTVDASLTITQKSEDGTVIYATKTISAKWPNSWTNENSRIRDFGYVTLPLERVPDEVACRYDLEISLDAGAGYCHSVCFLDTRGQTVQLTNMPDGTEAVWIDEPDPGTGLGQVYFSPTTDRADARNALILADDSTGPPPALDGGPMRFDPGDNRLLTASPNVTLVSVTSHFPAWLDERDE